MNESWLYSPLVNGFSRFIISRATIKLAAVVEFEDAIHFLKLFLHFSHFSTRTAIVLFLSPNWVLGCKCCMFYLETLLFLLFDNFSLQSFSIGNGSKWFSPFFLKSSVLNSILFSFSLWDAWHVTLCHLFTPATCTVSQAMTQFCYLAQFWNSVFIT